jgi:hypothetical protein
LAQILFMSGSGSGRFRKSDPVNTGTLYLHAGSVRILTDYRIGIAQNRVANLLLRPVYIPRNLSLLLFCLTAQKIRITNKYHCCGARVCGAQNFAEAKQFSPALDR